MLHHKKKKKKKTETASPKITRKKTQLLQVVQYLEDLVTVCSNIAPWLLGLREEQSGSETDSEISVSSQHSVYPSVCLSVYLTVKLSLSANSSPWAECKYHGRRWSREPAGRAPLRSVEPWHLQLKWWTDFAGKLKAMIWSVISCLNFILGGLILIIVVLLILYKDRKRLHNKFTVLAQRRLSLCVCVCVCVFPPSSMLSLTFNIMWLFTSHFPLSQNIYKELHRLVLWVTEAFIKIRSWQMKISSAENFNSMRIIQQIYSKQM